MASPHLLSSVEDAANLLFPVAGTRLRLATPLGLGKPNVLLNLLYERAKADPESRLTIFTALSLNPPALGDGLSRRFLGPFTERMWGKDYPRLRYADDARGNRLPENIRVHEFYLQAGSGLGSVSLQSDYQSINYTHVVPRLVDEKLDGVVQLVAKHPRENRYSLSCNPDLTRDLADRYRENGMPLRIVAVVHPELPYLAGDAEVDPEFFHAIVDDPRCHHRLFALPRQEICETDHAIGFHGSRLVPDGGTLQIGIGSLSEALVAALLCRHENNALYRRFSPKDGDLAPFTEGLYGLSEMVMDGFMHLRRAGILKRHVTDEVSGTPTYLHGAFFLGSAPFYQWLRELSGPDFEGVRMGRISKVNQLFGGDIAAMRAQRRRARFFNTCMQVTLLGGAASETLADDRVVSGVGGQYNFVAMSHELAGARSVLMLRSTSERGGKRTSNIVPSHGHLTIPRHLRDMVITEYGIADVRGKTDEETILALIAIADSEFQPELLAHAKRSGKVSSRSEIPSAARDNAPERICRFIDEGRKEGLFAAYPNGSDFTPEEEKLAAALSALKAKKAVAWRLLHSLSLDGREFAPELARLGLDQPRGWRDRLLRRLVLSALKGA